MCFFKKSPYLPEALTEMFIDGRASCFGLMVGAGGEELKQDWLWVVIVDWVKGPRVISTLLSPL